MNKIDELVAQMTLGEKVSFLQGKNFWYLQDLARLNIPQVMVSDGPHGVRKQNGEADHLGLQESIPAVTFPAGSLTAASFDPDLLFELGKSLGAEARKLGIGAILGPAMNIKRSPLGGRNFEYFSEDPLLAGRLAIGFVNGVQSEGVGTSVKHFFANNQEKRRMTSSSNMDERTMHEIYLKPFEMVIKQAKPWTIMSSYNRVNGKFVGDSHYFLTELLRDKWGFDGIVMSDWGGVNDRTQSIKAGLDLEMPGSGYETDQLLIEKVKNHELDETTIDTSVKRILSFIKKVDANCSEEVPLDLEADHAVARTIANESIVLLKNEQDILPLKATDSVAFIGEFAKNPRYQGGGSSHINSFKVEDAYTTAKENGMTIKYAQGFEIDGQDARQAELQEQAVELAQTVDKVVVFAGLPDSYESEGYDRNHMNLPTEQNDLITELAKVTNQLIVVLHNGSPVTMPWIDGVSGLVEVYLGGQAVGGATYDVLFGLVNPSGRLPETFPVKLSDNPSYLFYGGEKDNVAYQEGIFVGYRYYTSKDQKVLFPFGHGLSYTQFEYKNIILSRKEMTDQDTFIVSVDVTNTGGIVGKEVVQLYVSPDNNSDIIRPKFELKAFDKISLAAGETKTVQFELDGGAFAYWQTELEDWFVESGSYHVHIGRNASEMLLSDVIKVIGTVKIPVTYDINTTIGDINQHAKSAGIFEQFIREAMGDMGEEPQGNDAISGEMMAAMMASMPLRQFASFIPTITTSMIAELINKLNA